MVEHEIRCKKMEGFILQYAREGFTYLEVTEMLKHRHGYVISLSTLKRKLKDLGFKKRALSSVRNTLYNVEMATFLFQHV